MSRLVLDAGAFIALDRKNREVWGLFESARRSKRLMVTHAGIVGQVWRQPSRQARLAVALNAVAVEALTDPLAKAAGLLLAATATADVHDSALALICRPGDILLTSDVGDLAVLLGGRGLLDVNIIAV